VETEVMPLSSDEAARRLRESQAGMMGAAVPTVTSEHNRGRKWRIAGRISLSFLIGRKQQ
jgi:hypothetical protein